MISFIRYLVGYKFHVTALMNCDEIFGELATGYIHSCCDSVKMEIEGKTLNTSRALLAISDWKVHGIRGFGGLCYDTRTKNEMPLSFLWVINNTIFGAESSVVDKVVLIHGSQGVENHIWASDFIKAAIVYKTVVRLRLLSELSSFHVEHFCYRGMHKDPRPIASKLPGKWSCA